MNKYGGYLVTPEQYGMVIIVNETVFLMVGKKICPGQVIQENVKKMTRSIQYGGQFETPHRYGIQLFHTLAIESVT